MAGCIQENENLVNPPLITETVNIRFLNMASDGISRTLVLENTTRFENVAHYVMSEPQGPPYDSVSIQEMQGTNVEYKSTTRFKFARNSNYILIATPSASNDSVVAAVDTVIYLQTTIIKPDDTNKCFIKFLNLNPNVNVTYSIKTGCPNGEDVFIDNSLTTFTYRQSSGVQAVYEGTRVFSILKNTNGSTDTTQNGNNLVGIFELNLVHLGQYAIIVDKDDNVYLIDELNTSGMIIQPLQSVAERNAYVRVVNLSSQTVSVTKQPGTELASNLNPYFIDKYTTIPTCDATSLDKIMLWNNDQITDSTFISFDIYKRFTFIALDGKTNNSSQIIAVQPLDERVLTKSDSCIVRIVNANSGSILDTTFGINVSIGARTANTSYGYESGNILAADLFNASVSTPVYVAGGNVPITVFTGKKPTEYIFSANLQLENGKEYAIVMDFSQTQPRMTAIDMATEMQSISFAENTSYLQIVNATNEDDGQVIVSIPNILEAGKIEDASSITTFVPVGSQSISINNIPYTINPTLSERTMIIASGSSANPTIFSIQKAPMSSSLTNLKYRIINASDATPTLAFKEDSSATTYTREDITYQTAAREKTYTQDHRYAFYFFDQDTGKWLFSAKDVLMTLGKNYSVIFTGNKERKYKAIVLQEY
jgi:hypothetical protein